MELSDHDHAELLMLYQVTIDDIEKAKQWGWNVTYTTIAAQGAILGLFSAYEAGACVILAKFLFLLLAIILAILGVIYIRHSQTSLEHFRNRLDGVRNKFGEHFKTPFNEATEKKIWPLKSVVIGATILVCILIIFSKNA